MSLGGKPRSLELEEDLGETSSGSRDSKSALKSINAVDSSTVSSKSKGLNRTGHCPGKKMSGFVCDYCIPKIIFDHDLLFWQ